LGFFCCIFMVFSLISFKPQKVWGSIVNLTLYQLSASCHAQFTLWAWQNRPQQISVNNTLSSKGFITIGVPQGSILGPLLFSIYVNNLPNSISSCDDNMYADNTELHCSGSQLERVEQVLQDELAKVSDWMNLNWTLVRKSVCMLIGTQQRARGKSLCLTLSDSVLKQVSSTKYLGLYRSSFNLAKSCRLRFKKSEGENLFH